MKILVVEDDQSVAQALKLLLSSHTYAVDIATDGEAGAQMADAYEYDLILLDVLLPKLDGISLCQQLRANGSQVPILLLTGQGGGRQKAIALNAGADDYVVKPFDFEELIARVQALLRRGGSTTQPILTWGKLTVDPRSRKVTYGTHLLSVTPKEYAILELFLRNSQRVFSASAILDHVWSSVESPGEEAVRVHIKGLRQKLAAVGAPKDLVKTVHRVGYRLNPLYSSFLASQPDEQATVSQLAELKSVNQELRETLENLRVHQEELHVHQEELHQINEELEVTRHAVELEKQRYHDLFEFAPDGYLVTDRYGIIQEANRAIATLLAVEPGHLIGKSLATFITQSDRPAFRRQLAHLNHVQDWEVVLQPRHDTPLPVLISVTSIQDAQSQITGLRWLLRDIRQRKQMEQELEAARNELELRVVERTAELVLSNVQLQQQQQQWQALVEHALDAIAITDDNGNYIDANPAACQLFGVPKETLLRSSIVDFADPEFDFDLVWQQFLQQGQMVGEFSLHRPDGTVRETEFAAIANFVPGRHLSILRDISDRKRIEAERKQAELELRQREEFLSNIYGGTNQAIFVIDVIEARDFQYVGFNRLAEQYAGVTTQEIQGKTPEEAFGPVTGAVFRQNYEYCRQTGNSIVYEEHVVLEDHDIWTLTTLSPLRDEQGDIYRIVGTATDITDRKQMELSLQASEAKLSRILNSAIAALVSFRVFANRDWQYDYWSAGCETLFGYSIQELTADNQLWMSRVFPEDREKKLDPLFEDFFAERNTSAEYRFLTKDGTVRWISSTYSSQQLDETCWIVTVVNYDITDRKQAELEIRKFASLADNSAEFIGMCDMNFVPFYINAAARQMVGLDGIQQYRETSVRDFFFPEDQEFIINEFFPQVLRQGQAEVEIRFRHFQTGEALWMIYNVICIKDEKNQPIALATLSRNITDRKQAEASLQQRLLQEQLVADITQDIRRSLDLNNVLSRTVERVRELLNTDRVIILHFRSDWRGIVVAESVAPGWMITRSTQIHDPCFGERYLRSYRQGRVSMINDLATSGIEPCHAEFLAHFQVKANLVVPILQTSHEQDDQLWGLLIAHHCATARQWQTQEVELLQQLANQLGIALQQSELYQQTRRELLERQRTEAELRDSEARYRLLFDSNPNPMWVFDLDTLEFLVVNQAAINHYGYSREEFLGMTTDNIRPNEDVAALRQTLSSFTSGQNYLGHWRHLKRDNSLINVEILAYAFTLDGRRAALVLANDITDRLKAEQKIREQAVLLDIAPDAIFVRDLEHHILYWNRGAERLYGWQVAEAIGQKADELLQEDASQLAEIMQRLFDRGEWQGEMHKVTHSGRNVIVAGHWTLVRDEAGQPESILVVSSDITEKKQLEAQFYHAQRLESLGTLASGIAHDLNNVLTPILAISQLMRLKQQQSDEQSQEMLQILEESAKRGANMVKQILTFARGTEGKRVALQVGPLLREVIAVVQQTFPKSIRICQDIPDEALWLVSADPTHLHQIVMNLCVNARDAMPDGGTLTLSAKNYCVDAAFAKMHLDAQAGTYVLISVADTGTGIPPDVRDRIFDPFFTTKEPGQGTGLGLSIVLGMVKNYGGFVQVSSDVGKGTQMNIYLPTEDGSLAEPGQSIALMMGNGERVLVIDDDVAVQRTSQSLLENHHYTTLVANDGTEAIDLYTTYQDEIKVVLIDVMMPNMDGITAIRALKKINPAVQIIAISGLSANKEAALAAGASMFLAKPYMIDDLLSSISSLI
jgi:PAS domain S-box-containing protein